MINLSVEMKKIIIKKNENEVLEFIYVFFVVWAMRNFYLKKINKIQKKSFNDLILLLVVYFIV